MFDEENNEIIPEEQQQEEQTVSEEPIQETVEPETVEPANPYRQMSEEDYKESIKQMKQEYKQFQKDKKQAEKQQREACQEAYAQNGFNYNSHKGVGTIKTVLISLISSLVVFSFIFALLAFFPSKDKSFLASFYTGSKIINSGETSNPSGNDVTIGDNTVSKGDDVTINVTGESGIPQAVYAKAANSVVGIEVSQIIGNKWNQYEQTVSMGSGIIYSEDGIIVTNHHVVEAAINSSTGKISSSYSVKIYFTTDLTEWAYATELIGYDADNDIAVLRVNATNLQPIEFADSDTLVTGETAISIGSPAGIEYMNSISEGILSGLNRTVTTNNSVIYDLIQTTAAINPGNSGGALLNSEGKLIGICVIKIASTEYESMGFAINSNTVKTIVESIKTYGYYNKPLMGVTINTTYTPTIASEQGWPAGAYVEEVTKNSGADKAGIKAEDIITKMNDIKISSFLELRRFMLKCQPGDKVTIELYRSSSGETHTVEVLLDGTTK
ncbi:MAG: trypsin-like peptidase domain-containing protein [Clostridia bacterium]|nr:trypsin-like peptidase domain-containing protein [Clostridia bacterium]